MRELMHNLRTTLSSAMCSRKKKKKKKARWTLVKKAKDPSTRHQCASLPSFRLRPVLRSPSTLPFIYLVKHRWMSIPALLLLTRHGSHQGTSEDLGIFPLPEMVEIDLDCAQAGDVIHGQDPILVDGQRLEHGFQVQFEMLQAGHFAGDDVPASKPAAEVGVHVYVPRRPVASQTSDVPADVQSPDGGEAGGNDGLGEGEEGAEPVDVEGVDGVKDLGRFRIDLPAGFEQGQIAVGDGAEAGEQRALDGGAAVAVFIPDFSGSAPRVGDASGNLHQVHCGAAEDVAVDFLPQFQRQSV